MVDRHNMWHQWCRLCAKESNEDCDSFMDIFAEGESNALDGSLASAIGKYFWVNIKMDDNLSTKLCTQCYTLIEGLQEFNERVDKVQTMFCLLQNMGSIEKEEIMKVRKQCGLLDEDCYQMINKHKPNKTEIFVNDTSSEVHAQTIEQEIIFITGDDGGNNHQSTAETSEQVDRIKGYINDEQQLIIMEDPEHDQTYLYELNDIENLRNEENDLHSLDKAKRDVIMEQQDVSTEVEIEELFLDGTRESQPNDNHTSNVTEVDSDGLDDCELLLKNLDYKVEQEEAEEESEGQKVGTTWKMRYSLRRRQHDDPKEYSNSPIKRPRMENEEHQSNSIDGVTLSMDDSVCTEDLEEGAEIKNEVDDEGEEEEENHNKTDNGDSTNNDDLLLPLNRRKGRPRNSERGMETKARYECEECKRKYKNPNLYRKHMETMHNIYIESLPDYMCTICDKDYCTESRLKGHMRVHLPEEDRFNVPCPYCDRKFSQRSAMRQHVNGLHRQIRPYICDQCGRKCKTMAALNEHQLVHTNESPFECEVCHRKFKNKARLKSHMDTHAQSPHICSDCGLQLNTRRTLLAHRLVHTDEKRFKCDLCGAAFKRSKAFKNHLILHTGMRPYKCNFCGKTFSNGSNCRAHKKKTHPKELAEEDASGMKTCPVPMPRLEDLKTVKNINIQPRKMNRRLAANLPTLPMLALMNEQVSQMNYKYKSEENENDVSSEEMYEIEEDGEGVTNETRSIENYMNHIDQQSDILEDCDEETVIYEIIDAI